MIHSFSKIVSMATLVCIPSLPAWSDDDWKRRIGIPFATFRAGVGVMYDNSPLRLSSDIPESDELGAYGFSVATDLWYQASWEEIHRDESGDVDEDEGRLAVKFFQFGTAADLGKWFHPELSDLQPRRGAWRLYADGDPWVCKTCYRPGEKKSKLKRLSVGLMVEGERNYLEKGPFSNVLRITPALMLTWKTRKHCELNSTVIYYRFENHDDRDVDPDPSFDRNGNYKTLGSRLNLTRTTKRNERHEMPMGHACGRRGPFRRWVPDYTWSGYVGAEYAVRDTNGPEFDARQKRVQVGLDRPLLAGPSRRLWCSDNPRLLCRWSAELSLVSTLDEYRRPSVFSPSDPRDDDWLEVELALRKHNGRSTPGKPKTVASTGRRKLTDLRFGLALTRRNSNIPVYDFERVQIFATYDIMFGSGSYVVTPEGGGSRTVQSSGSSGSTQTPVAEKLPDG